MESLNLLPRSTQEVILEYTLPITNKKYPLLAFSPDTSSRDIQEVREFLRTDCQVDTAVEVSHGKYCSILRAEQSLILALPFLLRRQFSKISVQLIGVGQYNFKVKGALRNTVVFPDPEKSPLELNTHKNSRSSAVFQERSMEEHASERDRWEEMGYGDRDIQGNQFPGGEVDRGNNRDRRRGSSQVREGVDPERSSNRDRQREHSIARDPMAGSNRDRRRDHSSAREPTEGHRDRRRESSQARDNVVTERNPDRGGSNRDWKRESSRARDDYSEDEEDDRGFSNRGRTRERSQSRPRDDDRGSNRGGKRERDRSASRGRDSYPRRDYGSDRHHEQGKMGNPDRSYDPDRTGRFERRGDDYGREELRDRDTHRDKRWRPDNRDGNREKRDDSRDRASRANRDRRGDSRDRDNRDSHRDKRVDNRDRDYRSIREQYPVYSSNRDRRGPRPHEGDRGKRGSSRDRDRTAAEAEKSGRALPVPQVKSEGKNVPNKGSIGPPIQATGNPVAKEELPVEMEVASPKMEVTQTEESIQRERNIQNPKPEDVPQGGRWIVPSNRFLVEEVVGEFKAGGRVYGHPVHRVYTQEEYDKAVGAHKRTYTEEEIIRIVDEKNLPEWVSRGVEHMRLHNYGIQGKPWTPETSVWNVQWVKIDVHQETPQHHAERVLRNGGRVDDYRDILKNLATQKGLMIVELWGIENSRGYGKTEAYAVLGSQDHFELLPLHIPHSGTKILSQTEVWQDDKMALHKEVIQIEMTEEEINSQAPIFDWRSILTQEDQAIVKEYLLTTGVKTQRDWSEVAQFRLQFLLGINSNPDVRMVVKEMESRSITRACMRGRALDVVETWDGRPCMESPKWTREQCDKDGVDPVYSIRYLRNPYHSGDVQPSDKKLQSDFKSQDIFYGNNKNNQGMSLHSLLYEWDLERVVMCASQCGLSAWVFEDVISEGPIRSLRREVLNRMMAACVGTTRQVGTRKICSLSHNFMIWKYPMRITNKTCPQAPLQVGTYRFLREIGLIHGKGGNLPESFASAIHHVTELFQERWQDALKQWNKIVISCKPAIGPDLRVFTQSFEDALFDDQDDDDDAPEADQKLLIDIPGGGDRRGNVSEMAQKRWKASSYSSKSQRALDLHEWEAEPENISAGTWHQETSSSSTSVQGGIPSSNPVVEGFYQSVVKEILQKAREGNGESGIDSGMQGGELPQQSEPVTVDDPDPVDYEVEPILFISNRRVEGELEEDAGERR